MQAQPNNHPIDEFDPRNAFPRFRKISLAVLSAPRTFFATMRLTGGLAPPVVYMAGCIMVHAVIVGFLSKNPVLMLKILALGITTPFITAGILHFILTRLLGARGAYEAALRVNAYAAAVNLVSWFPVGWAASWRSIVSMSSR